MIGNLIEKGRLIDKLNETKTGGDTHCLSIQRPRRSVVTVTTRQTGSSFRPDPHPVIIFLNIQSGL